MNDPARPHVLMTGPLPAWDMEALEDAFIVHRLWEATDRDAFLAERADLVRGLATRGEIGADAALMDALPKLEIIATYSVGTDRIDLAAAAARGIQVANTPDVLTGDVADLAVALVLAAARRIPAGDAYVRAGRWPGGAFPLATRVFGKRIGIVGFGRIGAEVSRRFSGFDVEIGIWNRTPRPDIPDPAFRTIAELAAWADILIVALAGGPETRGVIDAAVLSALGPEGFLVNVSRGTTVNEEALIDALQARTIAGAGLDVFLNEPNIDSRFLDLDNVVLQPHVASATVETRKAMGRLVVDNLAAHFAGQPLLTPVK